MPLNYTVRCTKDDRYRVIRVATGEERGVYDTYGEAASCQDALEQGYRAACQVTGAPLIEPAARESTTTDRLLELAYDLEQQGKLSLAAGLRRMAHDPLFFATVAHELVERDSITPIEPPASYASLLDQTRAEIAETLRINNNDDRAVAPERWQALSAIDPIVRGATHYAARYGAQRGVERYRAATLGAPAPLERRLEIARLCDRALGLDDPDKRYDPELDCTVWERGNTAIYYGHKEGRILTVGALGTVGDIHTDEDMEDLRDLMALLDRPDVRAAIGGQPAPAVRASPTYRDEDGDYIGAPIGPVAFIDYHHGDDDEVIVSIDMEGRPPSVLLFGNGEIPLDQFDRAVRMVRELLAHPEVRAALAGQPA